MVIGAAAVGDRSPRPTDEAVSPADPPGSLSEGETSRHAPGKRDPGARQTTAAYDIEDVRPGELVDVGRIARSSSSGHAVCSRIFNAPLRSTHRSSTDVSPPVVSGLFKQCTRVSHPGMIACT